MNSLLAQFLRKPVNSVSREVMLSHRVALDLKVASAHSHFDLRVYRPDVDRDGFDMLLEQRSIARVLQLKSIMRGAKTRAWKVRTHLLHPSRNRSERLGFTLPRIGLGDGLDGAVLLIDCDVEGEELHVGYRFFDLAVAAAHASGQTKANAKLQDEAWQLIRTLRRMRGDGTVDLPSRLFLKVPSAEGVLAMLGMRTRHRGSWAYHALWGFRLWETDGGVKGDGETLAEHMRKARESHMEIVSGDWLARPI